MAELRHHARAETDDDGPVQKVPHERSPLDQALHLLDLEVTRTGEAVEALTKKLEPVLRPDDRAVGIKSDADRPTSSPTVIGINRTQDRLAEIRDRIEILLYTADT